MSEAPFPLDSYSLNHLYGERFYIVPSQEDQDAEQEVPAETSTESQEIHPELVTEPSAPGIKWRPKPSSQVLFIIHQEEIRDKQLGELLKKIVASIGIPFESAGFGIIEGEVNPKEYAEMPNPIGVVFDKSLNFGPDSKVSLEGLEVYFTYRLAELTDNQDYKRELWNQLKEIKTKIDS